MGKIRKLDEKNRPSLTILREMDVLNDDEDEIEIELNAESAVIHSPVDNLTDIDMILDSLEMHIQQYKLRKKRMEETHEKADGEESR